MRSDLRGWLPHRLRQGTGVLDCRWLYFGNAAFTDPFFEETTSRCLSLPENSFGPPRITRLDEFPEIASDLDALEPSAFVFHVSRCGSTLVSQLLGLDESCVTLSEVPFFDQ
ncbi:MAG: sulfotransferase family protein, partial [Chthoniobacteraceae bacterium]